MNEKWDAQFDMRKIMCAQLEPYMRSYNLLNYIWATVWRQGGIVLDWSEVYNEKA